MLGHLNHLPEFLALNAEAARSQGTIDAGILSEMNASKLLQVDVNNVLHKTELAHEFRPLILAAKSADMRHFRFGRCSQELVNKFFRITANINGLKYIQPSVNNNGIDIDDQPLELLLGDILEMIFDQMIKKQGPCLKQRLGFPGAKDALK